VGKYLPSRGREDIEREIAGTLADKLDDRLAGAGREATVEDALELLREMGHPRTAAASYLTHAVLIGPELYPLFTLVCRIALPIVAAVLIGVTALTAALGGDTSVPVWSRALSILGSALGAVLQSFAIIVIVFAGLTRTLPERGLPGAFDPSSPWDPRELPKSRPAGTIKASEQVASIVSNTVFLAVLLFLPRIVQVGAWSPGGAAVRVALSDGLVRLIPLLGVVAAAEILAALFLLSRRTHSSATLAVRAAVKALGVVSAALLLAAWPYVLLGTGVPESLAQPAELGFRVLNQVIRVGCILGIVFGCYEVGRDLIKAARAGRS
jgi:hypothetical protein